MRGLEWTSGKNPLSFTGAVFVISAQAVDLLQENSCTYGVSVSELTIYSYVEGNPLSFTDPTGLYLSGSWQAIFGGASPNLNLPNPIGGAGQAAGAASDFWRNYNDMRNANTIGADKYFHCKANCEASRRGRTGETTACVISDTREWFDQTIKGDPASASAADQAANRHGRNMSNPVTSCEVTCAGFRPNGLNTRY